MNKAERIKYWITFLGGALFSTVLILLFYLFFNNSHENVLNTKLWGGHSSIGVYQIFDQDTGVYYAVTENGDICPLYTTDGELKLVDQGSDTTIHLDKGELDTDVSE